MFTRLMYKNETVYVKNKMTSQYKPIATIPVEKRFVSENDKDHIRYAFDIDELEDRISAKAPFHNFYTKQNFTNDELAELAKKSEIIKEYIDKNKEKISKIGNAESNAESIDKVDNEAKKLIKQADSLKRILREKFDSDEYKVNILVRANNAAYIVIKTPVDYFGLSAYLQEKFFRHIKGCEFSLIDGSSGHREIRVPLEHISFLTKAINDFKTLVELYAQTTAELSLRLEPLTKDANKWFISTKVEEAASEILKFINDNKNLEIIENNKKNKQATAAEQLRKLNAILLEKRAVLQDLLARNRVHFLFGNPLRAINYGLVNNSSNLFRPQEDALRKNAMNFAKLEYNFNNYKSKANDFIAAYEAVKRPDTELIKQRKVQLNTIKEKIRELMTIHPEQTLAVNKQQVNALKIFFDEQRALLEDHKTGGNHSDLHKLLNSLISELELARKQMGIDANNNIDSKKIKP